MRVSYFWSAIVGLSLVFNPIVVNSALSSPRPTPIEEVRHICDEEENTLVVHTATPSPTPINSIPTPSPSHECSECELAMERIRTLSTQAANERQQRQATVEYDVREAVVRAVMFWMMGCSHCHEVLENVLPPLEAKYGDQLDIKIIEMVTAEDVDILFQIAASFDILKEYVGVPFLIIGNAVLIGSQQIQFELTGLIEKHLASGGVDFPQISGLTELLPEPVLKQSSAAGITSDSEPALHSPATDPSTIQPQVNGFGLAVTVIVAMVVALIYASVNIGRAFRGSALKPARPWLEFATPILAVIGAIVASYLAYVETQSVEAVCGPVGDCNTVQNSSYAQVLGFLPVGVLGLVGYAGILIAWLWGRFRYDRWANYSPVAIFGMSTIGFIFSLYLTYLEPFVIHAVCLWCLTSSVIITLLFLLSIKPALLVMGNVWGTNCINRQSDPPDIAFTG